MLNSHDNADDCKYGGTTTLTIPTDKELLVQRIAPLLKGKTVILAVTDKRQVTKPRVGTPTLVLVPGTSLNLTDCLIIGLQGFGCEFVNTRKITTFQFIKIGLTARASKTLVAALRTLYTSASS